MDAIEALQGHVEGLLALLAPVEQNWQPTDDLPDLTAEDWPDRLAAFRQVAGRLPDERLRRQPERYKIMAAEAHAGRRRLAEGPIVGPGPA